MQPVERPILMDQISVQGLLDNRKTQTRRVLQKQPFPGWPPGAKYYGVIIGGYHYFTPCESINVSDIEENLRKFKEDWEQARRTEDTKDWVKVVGQLIMHPSIDLPYALDNGLRKCPYGRPGDRYWVRERWRIGAWNREKQAVAIDYSAGPTYRQEWLHVADGELFNRLVRQSMEDAARVGIAVVGGKIKWPVGHGPTRWRPSIFMPRLASRILLELTGVCLQQVRQISFDDCLAEGVISTPFWGKSVDDLFDAIEADPSRPLWTPPPGDEGDDSLNQGWMDYVRGVFIKRWDSINAKRGFGWAVNPWVWVLTFKVLEIKARPPLSFYLDEIPPARYEDWQAPDSPTRM